MTVNPEDWIMDISRGGGRGRKGDKKTRWVNRSQEVEKERRGEEKRSWWRGWMETPVRTAVELKTI